MQRALLPELQGRPRPRHRHRRKPQPDRILLGLKIGTFAAVGALIGVVILLAAGESDVPGNATDEQRIGTGPSGAPGTTTAPPTTSAAPKPVIAPPALRTESARITGPPSRAPEPPPQQLAPTPAPAPNPLFAVIGEPCPEVGEFAITDRREPVMCYPPRGGVSRWDRVF
jgi:hypothetical protein